MKEKLIITGDGSHTVLNSKIQETYHSEKGAISESQHVFIKNGISLIEKSDIRILELGFGTGLNALLVLQYAQENNKNIKYFALEKFPLEIELIKKLNYSNQLSIESSEFINLHTYPWNKECQLSSNFNFYKTEADIENFNFSNFNDIDLVIFDAFSPNTQSKLWTESIFKNLYACMMEGGLLTTYSSAGIVKRGLRNAGFEVKRKKGPLGKFHMLNAFKPLINKE